MSEGNGNSYGRGRKPVVTAADDPLKLVMSSFELPVGLREAAKEKAKRLSSTGDLPKMDSISAYLRGCLVDFVSAPEPVIKNQVWKTIGKRLKAGTPDEIAKFLKKQTGEGESELIKTPAEQLLSDRSDNDIEEVETDSVAVEQTAPEKESEQRYDFDDWLD